MLALVSFGLTTNIVQSRKTLVTSVPGDFGCRPVVLAGQIGIQSGQPQAVRLQTAIQETRDPAFIVGPSIHTLVEIILGVFALITLVASECSWRDRMYILVAVGIVGVAVSLVVG